MTHITSSVHKKEKDTRHMSRLQLPEVGSPEYLELTPVQRSMIDNERKLRQGALNRARQELAQLELERAMAGILSRNQTVNGVLNQSGRK